MKNRALALGIAIASLVLALPACQGGTPSGENEGKSGEEIRCEVGGYAFKTIPDYEVVSSADYGMYSMNPNDIDFGDPNYNYEMGPSIHLGGFVPSSDLTIEEYAANGVALMSARYQATISGQPQVSVAGLMGIVNDFDYELTGAVKMKAREVDVEVNPKQFWTINCFSTVEKWDKTLADCEAVMNSVTFFEPRP
jgi:hypothetical protein